MTHDHDWSEWEGVSLDDADAHALVRVDGDQVTVSLRLGAKEVLVALDADQAAELMETLDAAISDASANAEGAE